MYLCYYIKSYQFQDTMKLVFATHNKNKFAEVKALMPEYIELLSLTDIDFHDDIRETEDTIEGNAILKANYIKDRLGFNCFADDTGLEVDALNGKTGIYSARYAGEQRSSEDNMNLLLDNLKDQDNRAAQFKTIIALVIDKQKTLFSGICRGEIIKEKRGEKGFGYDPIFIPNASKKTFAEMPQDEKAKHSHRGKAIRELIDYLKED